MPIVTIDKITRPEHAVEYIAQILENSELGLAKVVKYNDVHIGEYPAAQIYGAPFQKELHATHTFNLTIRVDIYILHAKLTLDRATRTYEDLKLATEVVAFLENQPGGSGGPLTMGDRVIAGWVESETPGVSPPRTNRGESVVSTRLSWRALSQGRF